MDNGKKTDGRKTRRLNNKKKTIETVLNIILETGEEPGIDVIVERSGISRRSVFYYFNNREMMIYEINNLVYERINEQFKMPAVDYSRSFEETLRLFLDVRIRIFEYIAPLKMITEEKKRRNSLLQENCRIFNQMEEEIIEALFSSYFKEQSDWTLLRTLLLSSFSWNTWTYIRYDREMSIKEYRELIEKQIMLITNNINGELT